MPSRSSSDCTRARISRRRRTLRACAHLQAKRDIACHRHVTEQRVVLEHEADATLARRHAVHGAIGDDDIAGIDELEAGEHAQQRGLARARRTQQRQEFARRNGERHAVQRRHAVERFAQVTQLDVHSNAPLRSPMRHSSTAFTASVTSASSDSNPAMVKAPTQS